MKIVIHFPELKAIYDSEGKPTQNRDVLSEWAAAKIMPRWDRRRGERHQPHEFVISQVLDEETATA